MADREGYRQQPRHPQETMKRHGPSASKVLAVAALLPVGGTLLGLSGCTLVGTLIGLAIATPLFLLFSPVLVPAVITIGLAVLGFLTSGALGLIALSALSWMLSYLRGGRVPEKMEDVKWRMAEAAGQAGHRAREAGQTLLSKAQDAGRREG